eukprot:8436828-Pyramimonas_sp.AAC.1
MQREQCITAKLRAIAGVKREHDVCFSASGSALTPSLHSLGSHHQDHIGKVLCNLFHAQRGQSVWVWLWPAPARTGSADGRVP